MNAFTIFAIGFGLSLDAFAVSIANGIIINKRHLYNAVRFGLFFGCFQMFMPILGWSLGIPFQRAIAHIDHWVAFGLLSVIGLKMIYEAVQLEKYEESAVEVSLQVLLGLSIATSMDALAVGLSFAFLDVNIMAPAAIIGLITFAMSFLGVFIGNRYGHLFENYIEIIAGGVLIAIGTKILVEHLVF